MGYRISYHKGAAKAKKIRNKETVVTYLGLAMVAGAIAFRLTDPEAAQSCRNLLLPGIAYVAARLEALQSGDGISASIQAFCQEILNGIPE